MCGIVGIVGPGAHTRRDAVAEATRRLHHRGPDAEGILAETDVAFGHRRLSILDTGDRANQPLVSPSGRSVIIFNGEIYNFAELRTELQAHGEGFTTTGDTEVLLRLVERDGEGALGRLKGMYAFAVWDRRDRSLLMARDRFGEKPLFLASSGDTLAFASELRSLLAVWERPRRIDREALWGYLETGFVPEPLTMFAGVRALRPGEWLRWREGEITRGQLDPWHYNPDPALARYETAVEAVREALARAVKRQMVSDVPIGAFLSGGIDSSSVVAMMQRQASRPVTTFNVKFEQAEYDESPIARRVAEHLGTDHHELTVADASFHEADLWRVVDHVGQPFNDSSAVPTFAVSRYARSLVTVALSGDGGDEMFGGYEIFRWAQKVERLAALPEALRGVAARLLPAAAAIPRVGTPARQLRKALRVAALPTDVLRFRALHWMFAPDERRALVRSDLRPPEDWSVSPALTGMPARAAEWTPLRRTMYLRAHVELAGDMLVKVDRMSMATSLEVRSPMLDPDLAELSMRLPDRHLFRDGVGKAVLRDAVRPYLPDEVFSHPKWGFNIPLHSFANDGFRALAGRLLAADGPLRDVMDGGAIDKVRIRGVTRLRDAVDYSVYQVTHQLWALMQLAAWMERFDVTP